MTVQSIKEECLLSLLNLNKRYYYLRLKIFLTYAKMVMLKENRVYFYRYIERDTYS